MDIDTLVNEKIEADVEFQTSLAAMPEEEKEQAIQTKQREVLASEFSSLKEKADKAEKAEELANNYKVRAEKAEKNQKVEPSNDGLSPKDALLLAKADVALEDVDEVLEYAKFKKVSIQDALKSPTLMGILSERKEERATAEATATGAQRHAPAKVTDETVLSKARSGELPTDDEGLARLVEAELNAKARK